MTPGRPRALLVALLVALALGATGCVAIPTDSSPQPLKSFGRRPNAKPLPKPDATMDPEALVQAFLRATADPTAAHSAARSFLTDANGARWDDRGDTVVLSNVSVLTDSRTDASATVRVVGDSTASLKVNGQLLPATGRVDAALRLTRTAAGWRIDGPLPPGVLLDRTQFEATYRLVTLYFADRGRSRLVGDPRWFYAGKAGAATVVARLLAGSSLDLAKATASAFPAQTELGAVTARRGGGVRIELRRAGSPTDAERALMAAQLAWTLSSAVAPAPYEVVLDGAPLLPNRPDGIRLADVQQYSPTVASVREDRLDVIGNGRLQQVDGGRLIPVAGNLNEGDQVVSASVSSDRTRVAAVRGPRPGAQGTPQQDGGQTNGGQTNGGQTNGGQPEAPSTRAQLVSGTYGGAVVPLSAGASITRPSFAPDHTVWAVVDGRPTRWSPDGDGWRPAVADTAALQALSHGPITALQVSPDGVRVALIVGGQVLFAVIELDGDRLALTAPRIAAYNIGNRALSLDWASPTTLVVARDVAEAPVTQVPVSGLPAAALVAGNLAPPVHAVAANLSSTYVADTRGVLVLSTGSGNRDQTWTDVPAAKGVDLIPVLP